MDLIEFTRAQIFLPQSRRGLQGLLFQALADQQMSLQFTPIQSLMIKFLAATLWAVWTDYRKRSSSL